MLNENENVNILRANRGLTESRNEAAASKIATLLTVVVTFQQKIELLKVKLCGHLNFSPQLYYGLIDRSEKGYITSDDFVSFIKKTKSNFNIDQRYLKALFKRLNQDDSIPADNLTYYGYLNIIKPYFEPALARDLLTRDSIVAGTEYNDAIKATFDDLICSLYVCTAEHEKIKELIILGDVEEGGFDKGELFNTTQIMAIITADASGSGQIEKQKQSPLELLYCFINKVSQYEVNREEMKYLLAYLMCHQYMLTTDKYLTVLFMPTCATYTIREPRDRKCSTFHLNGSKDKTIKRRSPTQSQDGYFAEHNFLNYVHPTTSSPKKQFSENPRPHPRPQKQESHAILEEHQRVLLNPPINDHLHTPILERFLRQSRVLKNMSRQNYHADEVDDNEAFVQVPIATEHELKPVNRDFNLQNVLSNNSNLHRSEYYQNLSHRLELPGEPDRSPHRQDPNWEKERNEQINRSGILGKFMLR